MVLQGIGMRRGDLLPAPLLLNWPSLGTMKRMAKGPENNNWSRCALALWFPGVAALAEWNRNYCQRVLSHWRQLWRRMAEPP